MTTDSIHNPESRWYNGTPIGKFWSDAYLRPEILSAAGKGQAAAEKHGLSGHAVALRWVLHHSALSRGRGDGMIVGARTLEQLKDNLDACDAGPLPQDLFDVVDDIWPDVEPVAPWT